MRHENENLENGKCRVAEPLEVRRRVDLGRRVVALEGALEGRAAGHGTAHCLGLLDRAAVVHEAVVLILVLLAAPDPPGDQRQTAENYGAADADDHADDGVAGLGRHSRRLAAVVIACEAGRRGRNGLAGHGHLRAIGKGAGDDFGDRLRLRGLGALRRRTRRRRRGG